MGLVCSWDKGSSKDPIGDIRAALDAVQITPGELWLSVRQWVRFQMVDFRDRGGMGK